TRCDERQHPAEVLGGGEVQRPAQQPRPHDGVPGDRLLDVGVRIAGQAQHDRPLCAGIILPLDRAEPADDVNGCGKRLMCDVLIVEPVLCEDVCVHMALLCSLASESTQAAPGSKTPPGGGLCVWT